MNERKGERRRDERGKIWEEGGQRQEGSKEGREREGGGGREGKRIEGGRTAKLQKYTTFRRNSRCVYQSEKIRIMT